MCRVQTRCEAVRFMCLSLVIAPFGSSAAMVAYSAKEGS
jgi:hypothetical protein